ncbi:MAG: SusC/RagA family TonB-linked outer membrane protein [Segetibacter sp.]|nr:SusC/RagA family TonB-linked outer membrane protein [Segetibacter sp.]
MRFNLLKSKGNIFALLFLFFIFFFLNAGAQNTSAVKGIVQNEASSPLPGVSVVIRNTATNFTSGTSTDSSGVFTFSRVTSGGPYTFTFSTVGYETQTLAGYNIKSDATLSLVIKMKGTTASLEQVVVVGYGTQRRKDLTGSIASVGSKDIRELAVTRVDQALAGKAAGVQVKAVSGEPGAAPQINIRGIGSISAGTGPLYVVDGFPTSNIETLNPNDIESLDILKDASATAIYGSRGSNGVIIINTRKGRAGKAVVSLDVYTGWQKVLKVPEMKNAREQAQYYYDGIKNRNIDEGNNVSGPVETWRRPVPQDILDVLSGKNTYDVDALSQVMRTAPQRQYQLTATGGSENVKYLLSGGYFKQEGIVIGSDFNRYSFRANVEAKLSQRLLVRVNLNPAFTEKSAIPVTGGNPDKTTTGSIVTALSVNNFYPLLDKDGNYTVFSGLAAQGDFQNPLAVARETMASTKGMRFLGNLDAAYTITDDLKFNILLGGNYMNSKGMLFKPSLPAFFNDPAVGTDNSSMLYSWLSEYTLNYNKTINKHNFSAVAGYTSQKETFQSNSLTSNRYPNNLVPTLSAVSGIITNGTSDQSEWSMLSYLARFNYNFEGKYYASASIRSDGSSRFGAEKKYGVFPSAAVAWRISDENFLKNVRVLNELKLRGSYGETGNNNIGNYEHYATINYERYTMGGVAVAGFAPGRLANPLLTWEKQKQVNIGLDAALFKRRINITIDHFRSRNTDLLLNVNVPDVTGFSTALKNIGEVKNTGWEFVLSTANIASKKFDWSTDFNLSTYKNEVVKLGPTGDPIYSGGNVTMIGQPIGMFYGWLTNGIFKTQAELDAGPIFNPGAGDRSRVGDIRFVDISGPSGKPDGVINSFDKTIMGSPYPDFYYGMTNRFSYDKISLSITLQGSQGNEILNLSRASGNTGRGRYRQYAFSNNYWKSEQDPGDGVTPRPNDAPTGNIRGTYSQFWLDNGSFLRVNNISLAYLLPDRIAKKLALSSLRVYANATNPFLFTKYTAFNPDVSNSENALTPGNELNNYPIPKTLIIGLTVGF